MEGGGVVEGTIVDGFHSRVFGGFFIHIGAFPKSSLEEAPVFGRLKIRQQIGGGEKKWLWIDPSLI